MFRTAAFALLALALASGTARATEATESTTAPEATVATVDSFASARVSPSMEPRLFIPSAGTTDIRDSSGKRPALLPALYVGLAGLQAFDAFSTSHSLARGAVEANPMMQGVVGNKAALWSLKAGMTVGPILIAERMWKTNRVGAVVLLAIVNGVQAAVAMNNARVMRQLR